MPLNQETLQALRDMIDTHPDASLKQSTAYKRLLDEISLKTKQRFKRLTAAHIREVVARCINYDAVPDGTFVVYAPGQGGRFITASSAGTDNEEVVHAQSATRYNRYNAYVNIGQVGVIVGRQYVHNRITAVELNQSNVLARMCVPVVQWTSLSENELTGGPPMRSGNNYRLLVHPMDVRLLQLDAAEKFPTDIFSTLLGVSEFRVDHLRYE